MATILEAYQRWASVDFDTLVDESIKENESIIIDAQVDQMRHGLNSDSSLIGTYTPTPLGEPSEYAKMKNLQNSLPGLGNVDLILFGDFTGNIELEYDKEFIKLVSKDEKNDRLLSIYGQNVMGLIPAKLGEINQGYILWSLLKNLRNAVQL